MKSGKRTLRRKECAIDALARRQRGVVTREQAISAGLSKTAIQRRLASGAWVHRHQGVYAVASTPPSWHQRLLGAVLWGGGEAVVSHRSAAALWRFPGCETDVVEISVPRSLRSRDILIHRTLVDRREATRIGLFPVTDAARTLLHLAALVEAEILEVALDDALRRTLTSPRKLAVRLQAWGTRRYPGVRSLRPLIIARLEGQAPSESLLEVKVLHLLERHKLPQPIRQYTVLEGSRTVARVDFAYPDLRVAIEADGYRYHAGVQSWRRDLERRNVLAARGWRVLHVTWADVEERPGGVVARIRRTLERPG